MEIQSFMLCRQVEQAGPGNVFHARWIGLHSFYSLDGVSPLTFTMPYFMLLRRPERGGDEEITLRFSLVDLDGKAAGEPRNVKAIGQFPSGFRFMTLHGTIAFSFSRMGDYRLDITADEKENAFFYQYDVEVTPHPA